MFRWECCFTEKKNERSRCFKIFATAGDINIEMAAWNPGVFWKILFLGGVSSHWSQRRPFLSSFFLRVFCRIAALLDEMFSQQIPAWLCRFFAFQSFASVSPSPRSLLDVGPTDMKLLLHLNVCFRVTILFSSPTLRPSFFPSNPS